MANFVSCLKPPYLFQNNDNILTKILIILPFIFRSTVHLKFVCVGMHMCCEVGANTCVFPLHAYSVNFTPQIEKKYFF